MPGSFGRSHRSFADGRGGVIGLKFSRNFIREHLKIPSEIQRGGSIVNFII